MREDREIGVLHGFLTHTHFVRAVGNTHANVNNENQRAFESLKDCFVVHDGGVVNKRY
jgi:hypothetical protein